MKINNITITNPGAVIIHRGYPGMEQGIHIEYKELPAVVAELKRIMEEQ